MIGNYPDGTDQSYFDQPQERNYIVEVSGFVEVKAFNKNDAIDLAKEELLFKKLNYNVSRH